VGQPLSHQHQQLRSWTQDFIGYIKENKVPSNKEEATRIIRRSKNYVLVGNNLYRRATSSGVLLKCISRKEGKRNPRRNPLRLLRQPHSLKDSGGQNFPHRFLLANSFERCRRTSQTVQRVPNVRKASSRTSSRPNLHPSCLAICMLGAGSSRTTQKGQRWI
jgi:hypothetical protein